MNTTYLGDGVYAEDDGENLELYTERGNGRHWLVLGDQETWALLKFLERSRGITITVTKPQAEEPEAASTPADDIPF